MKRRMMKHETRVNIDKTVKASNRLPCNSMANFMFKKKRGDGKFRSASKLADYLLGL